MVAATNFKSSLPRTTMLPTIGSSSFSDTMCRFMVTDVLIKVSRRTPAFQLSARELSASSRNLTHRRAFIEFLPVTKKWSNISADSEPLLKLFACVVPFANVSYTHMSVNC
jgi:hypothetical protein